MRRQEANAANLLAGDSGTGQAQRARAPSRFRMWVGDEAAFSTAKVCSIHHNYHQHPLMQPERLAQLARSLMPNGQCRFIAPGTSQSSPFQHKADSPDGLGIEEVFRRIEEPGSWVALYHVETDLAYDRFLREALDTVKHLIDRQEGGVFKVNGFMFISAPPSVTPFHIDRENNFWLQIRGRKTINVWDPTDRETVSARDVEEFIVNRSLAGVKLQEEARARSHEFDTGPGEGVYFPSTSPHTTRSDPHWARPGDGISISIGIVFYTPVTRRRAYAHFVNRQLRRLGFEPQLPGASSWGDRVKHILGRVLVIPYRLLRGYSPPPGF
jgi:hypothetical protein